MRCRAPGRAPELRVGPQKKAGPAPFPVRGPASRGGVGRRFFAQAPTRCKRYKSVRRAFRHIRNKKAGKTPMPSFAAAIS